MKIFTLAFCMIFSLTSYAQGMKPVTATSGNTSTKLKSGKGKTSLKPVIDFNPKKIIARANVGKNNKIVEKITIINQGEAGIYKLVFHDYNVDEFGALVLKDYRANKTNVKHGMLSWIKYDSAPFTLKAKESKDVFFEVNVPKDGVGSKYAHFTLEPVIEKNYVDAPKAGKIKSAFQMKLNLIGLLVVDVVGTGVKKVELEYVFDEKIRRHIVVLKNVGDHYLSNPVVSILVLDKNKKIVERMKLNGPIAQSNPGQKQVWSSLFSKPYPVGEYSVIISMNGENGNFVQSQTVNFKSTGATPKPAKPTVPKKKK